MASIKNINNFDPGASWVVKRDVDFTSVGSNTNWLGAENGTYPSVGGVGWGPTGNPGNSVSDLTDVASEISLNSGTGITITCDGDDSNYWGIWQNGPRVVALLSDLIPGMTYHDTVCFQAVGNCTQDPIVAGATGYMGFGLSIGRWGVGLSGDATYSAMCQTMAQNTLGPAFRNNRGSSPTTGASAANNFTFFEMIFSPSLCGLSMTTDMWSGTWPEPGSTSQVGQPTVISLNDMLPPLYLDPVSAWDGTNPTYVGVGGYASSAYQGLPYVFPWFRSLRLE